MATKPKKAKQKPSHSSRTKSPVAKKKSVARPKAAPKSKPAKPVPKPKKAASKASPPKAAAKPAKKDGKPPKKPVAAPKPKAAAPKAAAPKAVAKPMLKPVPAPKAAPAPMPSVPAVKVPVRAPEPKRTKSEKDAVASLRANLYVREKLPNGYVPAETEPFMSVKQLAYFKNRLLDWRDELLRESSQTLMHLQEHSVAEPDLTDRASTETDRALELRTRDRERKLIGKIDSALQRIADGSYGYCEETEEPIGIKRLMARPIATLSIEAQERHERRERVYRDD